MLSNRAVEPIIFPSKKKVSDYICPNQFMSRNHDLPKTQASRKSSVRTNFSRCPSLRRMLKPGVRIQDPVCERVTETAMRVRLSGFQSDQDSRNVATRGLITT